MYHLHTNLSYMAATNDPLNKIIMGRITNSLTGLVESKACLSSVHAPTRAFYSRIASKLLLIIMIFEPHFECKWACMLEA